MPPKIEHSRKNSSQRLPPPALFQGPPSVNASNPSLRPPASTADSRGASQPPPLQRTRSTRPQEYVDNNSTLSPFASRTHPKGDADGTEAIWQEMQNALSEVELSAMTSERVFGEKHSQGLEDLRVKQLKLAQAWARSEADETVDRNARGAGAGAGAEEQKTGVQNTDEAEDRAASENAAYKTLDKETEKDILLARERREANDRYFDRVNNGVLDVVAKLEEVAQAMRAVQRESKDIWSESDTMSATASTSNTG